MKHIFVLPAVIALLASVSTAQQQTRLSLQVEYPNGGVGKIDRMLDRGIAQINFGSGGVTYSFFLFPTVRDAERGIVTVAIRKAMGRDSDLLDELELTIGTQTIQTNTTPAFRMGLIEIVKQ